MRSILSVLDYKDVLFDLLNFSKFLKEHKFQELLKGKSLGMIFEKPSTRTRVSFEVAMTQLGGHALNLSPGDLQLARGESIEDTARTLSRYVDAIMIRAKKHENLELFAEYSGVPVINGLTEREHPCQALADLFTIREHKGFECKLVWIGDANNVCNSLMLGSSILGMDMVVSSPKKYKPRPEIFNIAKKISKETGGKIAYIENPKEAIKDADIVYTDVWVSMGDEEEYEDRIIAFKQYQVNKDLLEHAKDDYIFMHCLPAQRGLEVTDDIIDGKNSVVFDQAENRLHTQKALLVYVMLGRQAVRRFLHG